MKDIWTIFEQYLNNIWTIFEPYLNMIWTLFEHDERDLNNICTIFEQHLNNIWAIFEKFDLNRSVYIIGQALICTGTRSTESGTLLTFRTPLETNSITRKRRDARASKNRQINYLLISLVKPLLSRNFC